MPSAIMRRTIKRRTGIIVYDRNIVHTITDMSAKEQPWLLNNAGFNGSGLTCADLLSCNKCMCLFRKLSTTKRMHDTNPDELHDNKNGMKGLNPASLGVVNRCGVCELLSTWVMQGVPRDSSIETRNDRTSASWWLAHPSAPRMAQTA